MARWKLWFLLLLPLFLYIGSQETRQELLVKIIGKKTHDTPICTNDTQNWIMLIICKIITERSRGAECRLLYVRGRDSENDCDSRFTLMTENHIVFLHLTSLTPEDSGNYTCHCSRPDGTNVLHLNITVTGAENITSSTEMPSEMPSGMTFHDVIAKIMFIIVIAVTLGLIYRRCHHGRQTESMTSEAIMEPRDIEPYSTFLQRENGLYSVAVMRRNT